MAELRQPRAPDSNYHATCATSLLPARPPAAGHGHRVRAGRFIATLLIVDVGGTILLQRLKPRAKVYHMKAPCSLLAVPRKHCKQLDGAVRSDSASDVQPSFLWVGVCVVAQSETACRDVRIARLRVALVAHDLDRPLRQLAPLLWLLSRINLPLPCGYPVPSAAIHSVHPVRTLDAAKARGDGFGSLQVGAQALVKQILHQPPSHALLSRQTYLPALRLY